MAQVFEADGRAVPVTVIEAGPCTVLQVRTPERDGYRAVQLGFADKPRKQATAPERGHVKKTNSEPKRFIRELPQDDTSAYTEGQVLTVELFKEVKKVDVVGTSKGRGFSGLIRRHGFHGLPASHGVKRKHRSPGSVGASADPARVLKGTRMAGQMGAKRATVRNLDVVRVIPESNLVLVRGGVPGPNGGWLIITRAKAELAK
jgi:large subunit ribosomal protein L3